jgi:hypothetical protein
VIASESTIYTMDPAIARSGPHLGRVLRITATGWTFICQRQIPARANQVR